MPNRETPVACFLCRSCGGACWELHEGVCIGCRYTLCGGDLAPDDVLLNPTWTARLLPVGGYETNWWCS